MPLNFFKPKQAEPIPAGLYHFDLVDADAKSRVHLRVDADHSGLLIVNASRVVQLNPSAAQMAYYHLNKFAPKDAIRALQDQFKVPRSQLSQDYAQTTQKIDAVMNEHSGLCPVCDLDLEKSLPFTADLSAPYRMDIAITYRCNNACAHCYNARARNYPEMDTAHWMAVIDRLWELRIPHVVFTGGEPTLRDDLPELVAYAQHKGLVTGINTNGRRLADQSFLNALVEGGLDHVQITFESHSEAIHDEMVLHRGAWQETLAGLRNVVTSRLYMMTNTTLLENNAPSLEALLDFLAAEKVPTVGLNALIYSGKGKTVQTGLHEKDLPALLEIARRKTDANGQRLIWYTPTQYCHFNPTMLGLGIKGCTAAYYNMCIEPDGQVLPCQSYYHALGHILDDSWDSIWNHSLSKQLRERTNIPEACTSCDFLNECGGGCPLAREHQNPQPIIMDLF